MIKGHIDVEIRMPNGKKIKETFKENVELESWSKLDNAIMSAMLETMNNSPYIFTGSDNYGGTLVEDNGNVWQFTFEKE